MKFEKISENKLKVILSSEDMKKYNLAFDKLLNENNDTNMVFWEILSKATKETGMKFESCKVIVEALKKNIDTYILIITKHSGNGDLQTRYKFKKKNQNIVSGEKIFVFKGINDFICFAKANLFYCFLFDGKNSLYRVGNDLILELSLREKFGICEKIFCDKISEYSVEKRKSELYLPYIKEYGNVIIKDSALKMVYYEM